MVKLIEAEVLLKFHEDNERMVNSDEKKRIEKSVIIWRKNPLIAVSYW